MTYFQKSGVGVSGCISWRGRSFKSGIMETMQVPALVTPHAASRYMLRSGRTV